MPSACTLVAGLVACLVLVAPLPRDAEAIAITDRLASWWDFDGAGTVDSSGNGRNLTLRSNPNGQVAAAPSVRTGGVGGGAALQFPPATTDTRTGFTVSGGDAIRPDELAGSGDPMDLLGTGFAFQAWVNFDALPSNTEQWILAHSTDMATSSWAGWNLNHYRDPAGFDQLIFTAKTSNGPLELRDTVALTTGHWNHIVITAGSAGPNLLYDMYFNGVLIESTTSGGMSAVDVDLRFGHQSRSFGGVQDIWYGALLGSVDQVAFWTRSLTSEDVTALYNGGAGFVPHAVPEPSSLVLAAAGLLVLAWRRARRGHRTG